MKLLIAILITTFILAISAQPAQAGGGSAGGGKNGGGGSAGGGSR